MSKNITDLTMEFIKNSNLSGEQVKKFRNFSLFILDKVIMLYLFIKNI